jgi:nitrilase
MASGPNVGANLLEAERLIGEAVKQHARLIVLPENFAIMGKTETDKLKVSERDTDGVIQAFLSRQAAMHNVWIVGGTIPINATSRERVRAACLLLDANGRQVARYDKIHLFDVTLDEGRELYSESQTIEPGDQVVVTETPLGRIGIAVCYDLRFPEMFRYMLNEGVEIIVLPAAFTALTGKAHWEVLVRARAIENLCYVIASAQGGRHVNGRETYGDSMIVDPWGKILDRLARGPGVVVADIDRKRMTELRRSFPAIEHRKYHIQHRQSQNQT